MMRCMHPGGHRTNAQLPWCTCMHYIYENALQKCTGHMKLTILAKLDGHAKKNTAVRIRMPSIAIQSGAVLRSQLHRLGFRMELD